MAYITLNKADFFHNLSIITHISKSKDKTALVLKDNAYGHGLREVALMAQEYGITKAVVRHEEEALAIVEFFEYILILADKPKNPKQNFCYTLNDATQLRHYQKGSRIEVKVNSGMNRNGIEVSELQGVFEAAKKRGVLIEGVFTHHCCADEDERLFFAQKRVFESIKKEALLLAREFGFKKPRLHAANSAALFRDGLAEDEAMARVGIAAYGALDMPNTEAQKLKPILSLYAQRLSKRVVQKGEKVGYGGAFEAKETLCVSNYDFGYGDGFLRSSSYDFVNPQGVKIVGRISMDNSSFLTDAEELLVFNDAKEAAKYAKTISYEVLTSLKPSLKRQVLNR